MSKRPALRHSNATKNVVEATGYRLLQLLITVWLLLVGVRAQGPTEYQLKAAFLFHFAQLVDWPSAVPGNDTSAFNVCTIGDDPFQGDLDRLMEGKSIGSRTVQVRHLKQIANAHNCQILFIGKNETKTLATFLVALGNDPVMTVGDADNFVQQGGIIGFRSDDDKIHFEINLVAAEHARLKISSRLLLLAKNVIDTGADR